MPNNFARFATWSGAVAIIGTFLYTIIGFVFAFLAIALGIKGLMDYNKDNSLGGKGAAISAIVVGILLLILIFVLVFVKIPPPSAFGL